MVHRQQDAGGHPGHQQDCGPELVPQAQLVGFGPAVHRGEGAEHGIADQNGPAQDQQHQ
jgi:hypothetical protein